MQSEFKLMETLDIHQHIADKMKMNPWVSTDFLSEIGGMPLALLFSQWGFQLAWANKMGFVKSN